MISNATMYVFSNKYFSNKTKKKSWYTEPKKKKGTLAIEKIINEKLKR